MTAAEILKWFEEERGITADTIGQFTVSIGDGAVEYTYPTGTRYRRWLPDGKRKFGWKPGTDVSLFNQQEAVRPDVFMVEGETDAMRLWQELPRESGVGVVGIPGIDAWRKIDLPAVFEQARRVWIILDNDEDYNVRAQVDGAWREIRASLGPKAKRVRLPSDTKDVCEFFARYDIDTLRLLCSKTPTGSESRYKPLDLTQEPPPVRWLVEPMLCRGDIHQIIGEPSLGKSWLTMALAVAVAEGWDEYLGLPISTETGRVLYLDEENAEDLVFNRLRKLGLTERGARNIRYLCNQHIRVDRDADELVDEALEFGPDLIVLDSLRGIQSGDENNASEMRVVFNDGIKPLARETGAAVVVIHHVNKTDSNSSFKRSSGSGDITAGIDCGYDVRAEGVGILTIANYKSRRMKQGGVMYARIEDTPDGRVEVVGGSPPADAF